MAEVVPFKQKFLLAALPNVDVPDCCLFSDAKTVFTEERQCLRHENCIGEPFIQLR